MESVPTIACRTTILCIVVGMLLTTTVIKAQQFAIEPESVVQAEGLLAKFECLFPGALAHIWFVNSIASTSLTSEIRVVEGSEGRPSVLTIPASSQFNNSVIQCAAASVSGAVFSRNATVIVEPVILEVLNGETKITVSVINNFTTNNLAYRVDIFLVPLVTNEMVALPPLNGIQNQVQFNYQQLKNHTVCDIFTFTVTPFSESGMEGNKSEPVTGFFTRVTDNNDVTPLISQGGNVLKKIVHLGGMVPNCTNFTSYQVTSDVLAPINKTIEDPQMINVSLPTDQIINMSVTLTSIMGVRLIFKDMLIRTTDVQDLSVDVCPEGNCASIEYVEGTISPGALVCVIGVLSDNSLDLESIRLMPIRRNMSDNFTIPVAVSGNYSVVAFDLENNNISVPRMPMSVAADDETMFLSNESSTVPNSPPNSEGIAVTSLPNESAEVTCTTTGQSCLALFQSTTSPTSLNPMVMIGFIEPPNSRTVVTLNATSDVYMVVYTWNSESGETIFDGKVSFISQLELPTSLPSTQPPPDSTESTSSSSPQLLLPIVIVVILILVIAITFTIVVIVVLYRVKRYKRGNKVLHSSDSQGISTNTASPELDVGAPITTYREEVIALYDVARPENMSIGLNTADIDDTLLPGYDVVCKENMPSPEYETVPSAKAGKPTPTTSENPPPLPPPMIRGDSEAPDLPPPYNPAVDNESIVVMSVESSISQSAENQSVDEEVDESVKRDLSVSTVEHDGTTEEAIGSTEAQLMDVDHVDTVQSAEGRAGNNDHSGQKAMIAARHQYILTHKPFDKGIMKDSSKVGYSKVDNDKLKPVVPQPVAKAQGKYIPLETKPASSDAKDVGASITLVPVVIYDVACPDNMSLECNTDDRPPPGYDVICKNIQSPEYETIPLALAGKAAPTTSENPPPLPPPIIRGDEGLENDGVLTEETTSTSQAKDERTEDGGDDGLEAMITAQHQYTLVVPKPASIDAKVKDSSTVIYSEVDKDKLTPPVAKTQGQYIPVETRPASSDAKVMDSTKVVYVQVDKDKLKPVDLNEPSALPPRRPVTNTEELHTEKTLALPPRRPDTNTKELHTEKTLALAP